MVRTPVRKYSPTTLPELRERGFTDEEMDRLVVLKASYPYIEFVDSEIHWRRLLFLKWRLESGDLHRG